MTLDEFLEAQSKIVDGKPSKFYGAVRRQQNALYREIGDLLDELEVNEAGDIITSPGNYAISEQINDRMRQAFYNEDYVGAVNAFADGFDDVAKLNDEWLSGVLGGDLTKDMTLSAQLLIERQKRNAVELLVSTSAMDSAFFTPINNTLIESVSSGESIRELNRNIRAQILGNKDVDGKLLSYSKQIANDAIATGDRNYSFEVTKNADIEFYRYSGGTISDTREFCTERNGGYYHRKEVEKWGREPKNWAGRYRGTNPTTIFTWCGGYNCRHSLIPVSAASVPKKWLAQAIDKGYYKPSKAQRDKLGYTSWTERKNLEFELEQKNQAIEGMESSIKTGNWKGYADALKRRKQQLKTAKIERDTIIQKLEDNRRNLPIPERLKHNTLMVDAEKLRKDGIVRYSGNLSTEIRAREIEDLTGLKVEAGEHWIKLKKDAPLKPVPPITPGGFQEVDKIGGVVKEEIEAVTYYNGEEIKAQWKVYNKDQSAIKRNKKLDTKIQVDTFSNTYPNVKEQELRIGRLKKEELIVFDQKGNVLSRGKGEQFNVVVPTRENNGYGIPSGSIITHNHPRAIIEGNDPYGYGSAFSLPDLNVATTNKVREMRAVTWDAVHIIRKTNGTNFRPSDFDKIRIAWSNAQSDVRWELQKLVDIEKLKPIEASYKHADMVWERVSLELPWLTYFRYIRG